MRLAATMMAAAGIALVAVLLATVFVGRNDEPPTPSGDGAQARVGGITYSVANARALDPSDPLDAPFLTGLGRTAASLRPDRVLWATFVTATNPSDRSLPAARRFRLVDGAGVTYTPLRVARRNRYAYRLQDVPPNGTVPRYPASPTQDLDALGAMLVFSIPRDRVAEGRMELRISPADSGQAPGDVALG